LHHDSGEPVYGGMKAAHLERLKSAGVRLFSRASKGFATQRRLVLPCVCWASWGKQSLRRMGA
jgi:hypothetical protein